MTTTNQLPLVTNVKQSLALLWWMPLVRGILLILFAVILFARPASTALSLVLLLGVYWIVDGIFSIIEGLRGGTEKSRTWAIVGGTFGILAGLISVANPLLTGMIGGTFLIWLIGLSIIGNGIMLIFVGRDGHWTWWGLVMGILYVLFGIFVISNPLVTIGALVWLFAFWALVAGILAIVLAFRLRGLAN